MKRSSKVLQGTNQSLKICVPHWKPKTKEGLSSEKIRTLTWKQTIKTSINSHNWRLWSNDQNYFTYHNAMHSLDYVYLLLKNVLSFFTSSSHFPCGWYHRLYAAIPIPNNISARHIPISSCCGIFHLGWWIGDGGGNHSVHCIVVSKIILIIRS